jgi:hypothetical protein
MLSANIVCYGKHIAYPANFHFSSLSHIQLTLTRMHQAQENKERVKRKSNGLWQFELWMEQGKSFVSSLRHNKEKKGAQGEAECAGCVICVNVKIHIRCVFFSSTIGIFNNSICVKTDFGFVKKC